MKLGDDRLGPAVFVVIHSPMLTLLGPRRERRLRSDFQFQELRHNLPVKVTAGEGSNIGADFVFGPGQAVGAV